MSNLDKVIALDGRMRQFAFCVWSVNCRGQRGALYQRTFKAGEAMDKAEQLQSQGLGSMITRGPDMLFYRNRS